MKNLQKVLSLMLIVVLVGVVLVGCGKDRISFDGVENKKFERDLTSLRTVFIESIQEKQYKEQKINKILNKMNRDRYKKKLDFTELLLLDNINSNKDKVKEELNSQSGIMKSETLEEINWLMKTTTENPNK